MFTPLTYNYLLTSGDKNFASEFQYATYEICLFEHEKKMTTKQIWEEKHNIILPAVVCINRRSKGGLSENHSNFFFIKEETGVTAFKIQTTVLWHAFHYGLNHDIPLRKIFLSNYLICVLCTAPPFFLDGNQGSNLYVLELKPLWTID